ncbi:MAG: class I SAM-dependent methyltransferase [Agathobacter sp.]|uniref:class I SAM-dependent DNA methyltransferase n=1 Tax=Agathobacter sp. TaxID=2021311 RepID=UPI00258620FD|nr:class I SAM-dependent methyltransferase [Agathobacter sp.]MCR5677625.1 class I SAM-dependent methyltransferase [Agathobacter sp.]
MEAYTDFAKVYDTFMDNIPYEEWANRICELLSEYQIEKGLVLDLCCGTGKMTRLLRDHGYDMIGIDLSYEMLQVAMEQDSQDILYLNQDACEFELYGTVQAIVSCCDSLNYITEPKDLQQIFALANNYLEARGLFIFDMNTPYKYEKMLAQETFAENREDCAFIWDNYFDEETRMNAYELTLFLEQEDGMFARHSEEHYERAYSLQEVRALLEGAGMEFVAAFDGYTRGVLREESERMLIVAREKQMEGKYYE